VARLVARLAAAAAASGSRHRPNWPCSDRSRLKIRPWQCTCRRPSCKRQRRRRACTCGTYPCRESTQSTCGTLSRNFSGLCPCCTTRVWSCLADSQGRRTRDTRHRLEERPATECERFRKMHSMPGDQVSSSGSNSCNVQALCLSDCCKPMLERLVAVSASSSGVVLVVVSAEASASLSALPSAVLSAFLSALLLSGLHRQDRDDK